MIHPILVVEDDRKIANVIRVYLENAGYRVVHAATGAQALEIAGREPPLLVVLDLMLPDREGETLFQEIKELRDVPVIMVTAKSSEEERLAGFSLGADDYVVKPFSPRELVSRVKAVLKRAGAEDASATGVLSFNKGALVVDGRGYRLIRDGRPVSVTPTEFKIVATLAAAADKVFTREELVAKALGYDFEGYERSVDAHVKNVRHKIGDDPRRPRFIQTIYGVGYRFIGRKDA